MRINTLQAWEGLRLEGGAIALLEDVENTFLPLTTAQKKRLKLLDEEAKEILYLANDRSDELFVKVIKGEVNLRKFFYSRDIDKIEDALKGLKQAVNTLKELHG